MQRLDILLTDRNLASSRTHAQRLIKSGLVFLLNGSNRQCVTKPGLKVEEDCELEVKHDTQDRFVSRGALKLQGALEDYKIDVRGFVGLDVGQSTGGFTDCLLQNGAKAVVGIEVGHGQLAEKLRLDERVTCYEKTNARDLPRKILLQHTESGNGFDIAVMDVSFISQLKILPSLAPLLKPQGLLISLVKPQFEVGPENIGRNGIVKDSKLYNGVRRSVEECCEELGISILHYMESPIKGGDGNREFLLIGEKLK
jgi:23S rRNA (cytidine1920-2'-O)/16S rRNA (cytidine1409-2'-O)-methyltransferase